MPDAHEYCDVWPNSFDYQSDVSNTFHDRVRGLEEYVWPKLTLYQQIYNDYEQRSKFRFRFDYFKIHTEFVAILMAQKESAY